MKCARASALLGDHLEGELALPVRADIDEHLSRCPECKRELLELRATVALLRSLPTPQPPPHLIAEVMDRIDAGETRAARLPVVFRRVFDPRVAVPLAAGIAGLVLFATINSGGGVHPIGSDGIGTPVEQRSANALLRPDDTVAISTPLDPRLAGATSTSRIANGIERRIWDDKPVTLPGRRIAAGQASAAHSSRFRVQPRLTSTERNVAIRLFRSKPRPSIGFYGRIDPDTQYLDLDAQIDRAKAQPEAFLAVVGNTDEADRRAFIAPFAARAARRGDAEIVAGRLRRVSHPQARSAADLFEQSWNRTRTQPVQSTYSR